MSETLVEDGDSYPTSVTVPEDGDARNAASVVVGFQALANRLAHIWSKFANSLINGGSIAINEAVTLALGNEVALLFTGSDSLISFGSGTRPTFASNVRGPLFTAGASGHANRKVLRVTSGSGDIIVDPALYDTVIVSGISGLRTVVLSAPPTDGYDVVISNESTSQFVNYKPSGGSPFGNSLRNTAGDFVAVRLVWVTADDLWHVVGQSPYSG